jgi:hypothetical protein
MTNFVFLSIGAAPGLTTTVGQIAGLSAACAILTVYPIPNKKPKINTPAKHLFFISFPPLMFYVNKKFIFNLKPIRIVIRIGFTKESTPALYLEQQVEKLYVIDLVTFQGL